MTKVLFSEFPPHNHLTVGFAAVAEVAVKDFWRHLVDVTCRDDNGDML